MLGGIFFQSMEEEPNLSKTTSLCHGNCEVQLAALLTAVYFILSFLACTWYAMKLLDLRAVFSLLVQFVIFYL